MWSSLGIKIILLHLFISFINATDYCKLCKNHIACNNPNKFGSKCKNAKYVKLNKNWIVTKMNQIRNRVAEGKQSGLKRACRMAEMTWNDELAKLASYNVQNCVIQHDQCRATKTFPYSGQNLGFRTYVSKKFNPKKLVLDTIDLWQEERKYTSQANIDKFRSSAKGIIGHFTVMVADWNTHVGCAAVTYGSGAINSFLMACNFAANNMLNEPIYTSCAKIGKKCKRLSKKYPSLCAINSTKYN